ncbi:hypothetical protein SUGI_0210780 [Cryptomeria japonica]|nr:hypothetical protein SUGI_0210780 [Cryptomeria japonica]
MSSRVVLNENVLWISFQGRYDFGYLIKLLTNQDQVEFFKLFRTYFPKSYDIKNLLKLCSRELRGGLENLENKLKMERVGTEHQAGSDSLLTSRVFWKLQQSFINGSIEPLSGLLYDLGIEQSEWDP